MLGARANNSAIFVRCTDEEAERIRRAAKAERRTVSGFILHAVLNRIDAKEKLVSEPNSLPLDLQSQSSQR